MASNQLQYIQDTADDVAREVLQSSSLRMWHITGDMTAGKSTTLRTIAKAVADGGRIPIYVAPPPRALDAAQVALIQVAGSLKDHGCINGELQSLIASKNTAWPEQRQLVNKWLTSHRNDIVILCDEPRYWFPDNDSDKHFRDKATSVIQLLLDEISCQRIVAGEMEVDRAAHLFKLDRKLPGHRYDAWLTNENEWDSLADSARNLQHHFESHLHKFSPLNIRLLVALMELTSVKWVDQWMQQIHGLSRRNLSKHVAEKLGEDPEDGVQALAIWASCELIRGDIEPELLERFINTPLSPRTRDIVTKCILYKTDEKYVLHDLLRRDVKDRWLSDKKRAHRELAKFYAKQLEQAKDISLDTSHALRYEMEGFHHLVEADDSNVEDTFRAFFVEQLNILGRHLSESLEQYDQATQVFERATERDNNNDYAHHYLAYNLDVRGLEPGRVEKHYRRALELVDDHAWWWSRWITFLITRGLISESREAWDQALDALGLPDEGASGSIYSNLHKWVARLLLHHGKLDFAEMVLRSVPREMKQELRGFKAMERLLMRLREAQRHTSVFPAYLDPDIWWQTPALLHPVNSQDQKLVRWLAGRVDDIDEDTVYLIISEAPNSTIHEPRPGRLRIPREKFDSWGDLSANHLSPGYFVELGIYGEPDADPLIRVHKRRDWDDPELPPLIPDPLRYLNNTNAIS